MSIVTSGIRRYDTHNDHDVTFFQNVIITATVTHSPAAVENWIYETEYLCGSWHGLVGLDVEWRPNFNNSNPNPVATLQLCVGRRCLIFQLLYAPYIPRSLLNFLGNRGYTFVGVGVGRDAQRLWNDHGLGVWKSVDLANLARVNLGPMNPQCSPGLRALAMEVLGVDVEKPRNVTLSRWDDPELSLAQVRYACVDAYASYEIGRIWRAWEY